MLISPLARGGARSEPDVLATLRWRKPLRSGLILRPLPREEIFLIGSRGFQLCARVHILRRLRPRHAPAAAEPPDIAGGLVPPQIRAAPSRSEPVVRVPIIPAAVVAGGKGRLPLGGGGADALLDDGGIPPGATVGDGLDAVAVDGGGVGIVLGDDVGFLGDAVLREEGIEFVVASSFHLLDLDFGPGIHGNGSNKGDVNPEAAVLAGAL